ncbi:DUF4430 domain-containing protein [Haloimpatiens sp. FM7330]|uniref:DUF4430 domain-containing protein n=1 Tax=Haloimpatiens sp. FM7330 TaxID=3298610 RepID=UPI003632A304
MKNIKSKLKIILPIILLGIILVSGLVIKNHKNSSKSVYGEKTRVEQKQDSKDTKKQIDKKTNEKNEEKKQEDKEKKEESAKKDDKDKSKEEKDKKEASASDSKKEDVKNDKSSENQSKKVAVNKPSNSTKNTKSKKKPLNNKQVSVYMRVEGYNGTIVPRQKVTTGIFDLNPYLGRASGSSATPSKGWGVERFKEPTVAHALVKLLESKGYHHGSGYDFQDYGWGLYIAMINGDREFDHRNTSGWMYRVGNVLPNIGCQGKPIKGGEEILWYFGAYGFDTLVTEMKVDKRSVGVGKPITITLNGIKNDINTWKEFREPAKNATIYVNGKPYCNGSKKAITDAHGRVTIKFNKKGTYTLSAERINSKNLKDIVRPLPVTIKVN